MIEARQLTKRYGDKIAVDGVDFTVRPGAVTGFLGPNGAGKSTTMRMIIGLDAPTAGTVTVNGRRYAQHSAPLHEVGALLEARSIHPGRSAFDHLIIVGRGRVLADTTVRDLVLQAGGDAVVVATADPAELRRVLAGPGVEITGQPGSEQLTVTGLPAREIGLKAAEHGLALFELTARTVSLEEAFMDLTKESVEYHATTTPARAA
jgi:ABC-type multidrug transport system ATPase subunit